MWEAKHTHLFTGLNLYLEREEVDMVNHNPVYEYSVTLEGDAIREQYKGRDESLAEQTYETILEHYRHREEEESKLDPRPEYKQYEARELSK